MSHERARSAMLPFTMARAVVLGAAAAVAALFTPGCGTEFIVSGDTTGAGGGTTTGGGGDNRGGGGGSTTGDGGSNNQGGGGGGTGGSCADASQCDDGDPCTEDACPKGSCTHQPAPTDDGDACTLDMCTAALGVTHTPIDANDNNPCTQDLCDPATGVSHPQVDTNDGNACTVDACDPVNGVSHSPIPINDGDACTLDGCNMATGPTHLPINTNDGNACTVDGCDPQFGPTHAPVPIDDDNPCTNDSCDPMIGVQHTPLPGVDDGNACTTDTCDPVFGVQHLPVNTNDGNACTKDTCDPGSGVKHDPIVCDDNNVCTSNSCNPNVGCVYGPLVYFAETFADNSKGWMLDPSWQIGPAMGSNGQVNGNPDPGLDHTPTMDNGVAGVNIGGNIPMPNMFPGPVHYLTSPVINLANVPGPVVLKLWRWLNIDTPPYMQAYIEVFNGASNSWVTLWSSTNTVADNAWVSTPNGPAPTIFDVTSYKSGSFRVRIGYQVKLADAFAMSGWNVDDLALVPAANCLSNLPGG